MPGSYILGKTVLLDGLEGGLLTILLSWLYYDSFLAIPFLIPLIWFWHKERENVRREKGQELFRKMFREWILLLASSLTAGYSMENALVQSYQELCLMFPKGGIMQEELKMMLAKTGNNQRPEILFGGTDQWRKSSDSDSWDGSADGGDHGYPKGNPHIAGRKSL